MPTDMTQRKSASQLQAATLAAPFSFTKNMPVLKLPGGAYFSAHQFGNLLFDVESDPLQLTPLHDSKKEAELLEAMTAEMVAADAPEEQYVRLGISRSGHA